MYLRFGPRYEDYRLAAAVGIILGAYAGFFFGLYWLMQPSVATNPGLASYRPHADTRAVPSSTSSLVALAGQMGSIAAYS